MDALKPNKERRIIFCAAAVAIVALQWLAFSFQIAEIDPETYALYAVELEGGGDWRFGYVRSWHGAMLVKTPNLDQWAPDPSLDPEYEPDLEFDRIMREELEALPRRGLLELLLYLTCLGYACFAMGPMRRALQGENPGRLRVLGSEVLVWMGLWYIIAMPLPIWGYGTPVFTNWLGPGALCRTGPWFGPTPVPYNLTITYKYLMVALTHGLSMVLCIAGVSFFISKFIPGVSEGMIIWLSGLLCFRAFSVVRGIVRILLEARDILSIFRVHSDTNCASSLGEASDEPGHLAPLEITP